MGMWNYIWPDLLKAIDTEPENEVLSEHMQSLAKVFIDLSFTHCLSYSVVFKLFYCSVVY